MATLALTAALSSIPIVGPLIGGTIGAVIDNRLVYPFLFGNDEEEPEELAQQRETRVEEGSTLPIIFGGTARVPGTVIWLDFIEVGESPQVQSGQGKGGGAGSQIIYINTYQQNAAIAFARGNRGDITKVWANSKPIIDEAVVGQPLSLDVSFLRVVNTSVIVTNSSGAPTIQPSRAAVFTPNDTETGQIISGLISGAIIRIAGPTGGGIAFLDAGSNPNAPSLGTPNSSDYYTVDWNILEWEISRIDGTDLHLIGINPDTGEARMADFVSNPIGIPPTPTLVLNNPITLTVSDAQPFDTRILSGYNHYKGEGIGDSSFTGPGKNSTADPDIVAKEGVFAPPYDGVSYLKVNDLDRNQFGNTFPLTMEALFEGDSSTVEQAVSDIIDIADSGPLEHDTSGINSEDLGGYAVVSNVSAKQALQPLQIAYDIVTQVDGTKVKLFTKSNSAVVDIPEEDLGAYSEGANPPFPVRFIRKSSVEPPSSITLYFRDPSRNYEEGSVIVNWHIARDLLVQNGVGDFTLFGGQATGDRFYNPIEVRLPLTLDKQTARQIAYRILRDQQFGEIRAEVDLPPKYVYLAENDVIRFTFAGIQREIRVEKIDKGEDGLIRIEGPEEVDLSVIPEIAFPEDFSQSPPSNSVRRKSDVGFFLTDVPPLRVGDEVIPGQYFGVYDYGATSTDSNNITANEFEGALVYCAPDDGSGTQTYNLNRRVQNQSQIGFIRTTDATLFDSTSITFDSTSTTFDSGSGDGILQDGVVGTWDRINTLRVEMINGDLESYTEDLVIAGQTPYMLVGLEVIKWSTATLVGSNTYDLTNLLRGLRGTEHLTGNHVANEMVMVFQDGLSGQFLEQDTPTRQTRYYKFGMGGAQLASLPAATVSPDLRTMTPFSPTGGQTIGAPEDGVEVYWEPRSRAVFPALIGNQPLVEETEKYEVMVTPIVLGTEIAPVRTETVFTNQFTYTTAMYAEDGILSTYELKFSIRQVGSYGTSEWYDSPNLIASP